jgi:hypothetical protein
VGTTGRVRRITTRGIKRFEKARQKDLKSKNAAVRAAAAQYGNQGVNNGVVVHSVSASQMSQIAGAANGAVIPSKGAAPYDDHIDVYFNQDAKGKNLERTVAHEGVHVGDELKFIDSALMDGVYDKTLNPTVGQTEFDGFSVGAAVKKYDYSGSSQCGSASYCKFGPNDGAKIRQFLQYSPTYSLNLNKKVFGGQWSPQQ